MATNEVTAGLVATFTEIISATVRALAEMEDDDSNPGAPSTPAAIAAAERSRKITFAPEYRAFLEVADGWRGYTAGYHLDSTAELAESRTFEEEVAEYDGEIAPDLVEAVPIGRCENDAGLVLLLPSGEVVEWLYEEEKRHPTFLAFLAENRRQLEESVEAQRAARERTRHEWTPAYRDASDAAAAEEIALVLKDATVPPAAAWTPPKLDVAPAAVQATELVLRDGQDVRAEVRLNLVLYLGASPSPDEVRAAWRAFRRRFPVAGKLEWVPGDRNVFFPSTQADADDETFLDGLTIDEYGFFGVRGSVAEGRAVFNLRGLPPEAGDSGEEARPRASFLEVFVPADADPRALAGLALDLLALLPVRSGHGGFAVYTPGKGRDGGGAAEAKTFEWCRRFAALDVGLVDGVLASALTRVHPSGWLTILGRAFAGCLDAAGRLTFDAPISVVRKAEGILVQAGHAPTLGDVPRGEFPAAIAAIDRALSPLLLTGYRRVGNMGVGGLVFRTIAEELPPFRAHAMTTAWFRRFVDPQGFLGPTPIERGEQLLSALGGQADGGAPSKLLDAWLEEKKKGGADFQGLANHLAAAAHAVQLRGDDAIAALELLVQHRSAVRDRDVAVALNNLMVTFARTNRWARAEELLPLAVQYFQANPGYLRHIAACVYVRTGDREAALRCVEDAARAGYEKLASLAADGDLAAIADDPRFVAAVAKVRT